MWKLDQRNYIENSIPKFSRIEEKTESAAFVILKWDEFKLETQVFDSATGFIRNTKNFVGAVGGTILGLMIAQSSLMQLWWVSGHNFSKRPCHWWSSQLRSFTVPKPIGIDPEHERMKLWKCPQYYVERGCRRTGYVVPAVGWLYRLIDFKEQNIFMPLYELAKVHQIFLHATSAWTKYFHQISSKSVH